MQDVFFQSEIKWWIKKDSQCSLVLAAALAATRAKTNARKHRLVVILVAPAISAGPLALPPPPPPLHLRHLQQLGGGHLGARQDEGGHRAEAGLKLVRRVLLEATEAAADRTSIRPLLLLLLLPLLLLLLQLLPTYVCHNARHCTVYWKQKATLLDSRTVIHGSRTAPTPTSLTECVPL